MMTIASRVVATPIGDMLLVGNGEALTELLLPGSWTYEQEAPDEVLEQAAEQLDAYFAGDLRYFTLPLAPAGTPFQQQVWRMLREIPYGSTTTYVALARQLGKPNAARAVGAANGSNPIAIVIPCHRLIGSGGSLVGYGGGLERKRWLLDLESRSRLGDGD
jgi:methylated-DNA-[protein]-cysteine S-methyltransferase